MKKIFYLGGCFVFIFSLLLVTGCTLKQVGGVPIDSGSDFELTDGTNKELEVDEVNYDSTDPVILEEQRLKEPNDEHYQNQLVNSIDKLALIKNLFVENYGADPASIKLSFSQDSGDHLMGSVSLSDDLDDQAIFFAVKLNGEWLIAWVGSDTPYCFELDMYNFPEGMMEGCDDESEHVDKPQVVNDEVVSVMAGLQAMSFIPFVSVQEDMEFEWRDGDGNVRTIRGPRVVSDMMDSESLDTRPIESYFDNLGFKFSMANLGEGTMVGSEGYQKDNIVCLVRFTFDPETELQGLWVNCGLLE